MSMRRLYLLIATAIITGLMMAPSVSMAQVEEEPFDDRMSDTEGLFINLHAAGSGIDVFDDQHPGIGAGLKLGYGFSPLFTLYAGTNAAVMRPGTNSPFGLGHLDVGARFNLGAGPMALVPYVDLAVSGHATAEEFNDQTATMRGLGVSGGVGIQYFVNPNFAIDLGAMVTLGEFTEAEVNGVTQDLDNAGTRTGRLNLGISWYPF